MPRQILGKELVMRLLLSIMFLVLISQLSLAQTTPTASTPLPTTAAGVKTLLDTSFGGCPPPLVANVRKLETRNCHGACCLPCPASSLFYAPGQMEILRTATCIVRVLSCVSMVVLAVSYLVLPGRKQHPHLIVLFKFMTIAVWEGMGVLWLTQQRSLICYDDVLDTNMSNSPICGFQGIALVYLVGVLFVQGITLVANLHCLAVYRSLCVQKQVSKLIGLSFVLPLVLIIPPALQGQFGFSGYGSICFMSAEWVNSFFFYPVGAMMIVSVMVHVSTVIYMIKMYITSNHQHWSNSGTNTSSTTSQTKRQLGIQTAREITRMLKQQWRPGVFAMCQLLVYMIYFLFYFVEIKKFGRISSSVEWFQQWGLCLGQQAVQNIQQLITSTPSLTMTDLLSPATTSSLGEAGQRACLSIASPHVPVFWKLVLSDMAPAVFGICIFFIFGSKYELWQDWRRFFLEKVLRRPPNEVESINMGKPSSGRTTRDTAGKDNMDDTDDDRKAQGSAGSIGFGRKGSLPIIMPMTYTEEERHSLSQDRQLQQQLRRLEASRYNSRDDLATAGAVAAGHKTSLDQSDDDGFIPYQQPTSPASTEHKITAQKSPTGAARARGLPGNNSSDRRRVQHNRHPTEEDIQDMVVIDAYTQNRHPVGFYQDLTDPHATPSPLAAVSGTTPTQLKLAMSTAANRPKSPIVTRSAELSPSSSLQPLSPTVPPRSRTRPNYRSQ